MNTAFLMAFLITLLFIIIVYGLFVPKTTRRFTPDNEEKTSNNPMLKFMSMFGNELYQIMPETTAKKNGVKKNRHGRLEDLMMRSGNPWGLKVHEFIPFQYVAAIFGFIAGWIVWAIVGGLISIPWYVIVAFTTILAFFAPRITYAEQAKVRDLEFKKQLPEALDLLEISLSGGSSFQQAMRDIIPSVKEGVVKEEFKNIVSSLDSGRTLSESLESFALRAPNESVQNFVRAVQTATAANAPLNEILESQSTASRDDFFALVDEQVAQLDAKMMIKLTATMLPATILISVAPSVKSLMEYLG